MKVGGAPFISVGGPCSLVGGASHRATFPPQLSPILERSSNSGRPQRSEFTVSLCVFNLHCDIIVGTGWGWGEGGGGLWGGKNRIHNNIWKHNSMLHSSTTSENISRGFTARQHRKTYREASQLDNNHTTCVKLRECVGPWRSVCGAVSVGVCAGPFRSVLCTCR